MLVSSKDSWGTTENWWRERTQIQLHLLITDEIFVPFNKKNKKFTAGNPLQSNFCDCENSKNKCNSVYEVEMKDNSTNKNIQNVIRTINMAQK